MRYLTCVGLSLTFLSCESKPQPAPIRETGPVLAKVDEFEITTQDFQGLIEEIEEKTPQVIQTFQQKEELVKELINIQLLYELAMEEGFQDRFQFKTRIVDAFLEDLERQEKDSVQQEDIIRYYERHKHDIDEVSARHILLRADEQTTRQERLEILQRMEGWRDLARSDPSRFPQLARQYSQDSTAPNGGELGFFQRDRMVAPFSEAAFGLSEIGEVSDVVRTEFGYHLIQLSGDRRGVENHENRIRTYLVRRTQRNRLNSILERARQGRDITIYENEIHALTVLPKEITEDPDRILPEDFDERSR